MTDDEKLAKANIQMSKAKIALMIDPQAIFYATVCMSLEHVWSDYNSTAWTDGTTCGYNIDFWLSLTPEEQVGLIFHESLHVAYLHMCRSLGFDQERFNKAADYVINLIIINAGFQLPKCGLFDRCYEDLSTEEVYRMLPTEPHDPSFMSDLRPPKDEDEKKAQKQKIDDILIQATIQTRMVQDADLAGLVPGDVLRYVQRLINPVVPWHRHLARYMTSFAKSDWTYARVNRRMLSSGFILPTNQSEAICDIVSLGDLSGSVTQQEIDFYMSNSYSLMRNLRPRSMKFIGFDTKIHDEIDIKNLSDFKNLKFTGGGGTAINPAMQYCLEKKPTFAIIFTDGHFTKASINPGIPIIWIIVNNPGFEAPFGKVIHYNVEETY